MAEVGADFAQQQLQRNRKLPLLPLLRLWLSKLRDLPVLILADPEGRVTAPCLGLPVRPLSRVPWRQAGPTEKQS